MKATILMMIITLCLSVTRGECGVGFFGVQARSEISLAEQQLKLMHNPDDGEYEGMLYGQATRAASIRILKEMLGKFEIAKIRERLLKALDESEIEMAREKEKIRAAAEEVRKALDELKAEVSGPGAAGVTGSMVIR